MNGLIPMAKLFVKRNSATILTCLGAGGVVATAVLTAKAAPKAVKLLEEAKEEKGEELTVVEKVTTVAPVYIPAIVMGASTITCIFGANALNKRTQASLMSAYALLDQSYKQYTSKVKELYGEETDKAVRKEVVKDIYDSEDIEISGDRELFYDMYAQRYFVSTMDEVTDAIDALNGSLEASGCTYLNEFYEFLGIAPLVHGYDYGWSIRASRVTPGTDHIEFDIDICELEDGMECNIITLLTEPTLNYEYR